MGSKVLLITGCRSGIGLATAVQAAQAGHVVYAGLRDLSTKSELLAATSGLSVHPVQLDITQVDQRQAVVAQILAEQGRLDVLINNAGVGLGGFLEQLEEDELRRVLDINFFGTWAMTRACLPAMRSQKEGLIVMVSSLSGRMAIPGLGAYCTAKFALEGLGETWRHELRPFGIDVVLVEPGAYRTKMIGEARQLCRNQGQGAYGTAGKNVERWYLKEVVGRARDPSEVALAMVGLLGKKRPALRLTVGPGTGFRSFVIRFFPFALIERFFARVLRGPSGRKAS